MQTVTQGLPICLYKVAGRRDAGIISSDPSNASERRREREGRREGRKASWRSEPQRREHGDLFNPSNSAPPTPPQFFSLSLYFCQRLGCELIRRHLCKRSSSDKSQLDLSRRLRTLLELIWRVLRVNLPRVPPAVRSLAAVAPSANAKPPSLPSSPAAKFCIQGKWRQGGREARSVQWSAAGGGCAQHRWTWSPQLDDSGG